MRKDKRVISRKNMPTKLPIGLTMLLFIFSDYYNWSDLVNGIVLTLVLVMWAGAIYNIVNDKEVDVLKDK